MNDLATHVLPHGLVTLSNQQFDFARPELYMPEIEDIAHGLSMCCRFSGQCKWHYSVAQHSVLVSFLVPQEHALAGLLHDVAEAFMGDVPRPLKDLLPAYKEIEQRVEATLLPKFGVRFPLHPCIKYADLQALRLEAATLMPDDVTRWAHLAAFAMPNAQIECMSPLTAKREFLARWKYLKRMEAAA